MTFRTFTIRNQSGMSLVETMMVFGLLAVCGLGVMTLSQNIGQSGVESEAKVARAQFTSSLNSYLYSMVGCEDLKTSRPGGNFSETPQPMEITKWNYLGLTNIKPGYDANGRKLTPFKYFDLATLEGYLDPQSAVVRIPSLVPGGSEEQLAQTTLNVNAVIKVGKKSFRYVFNIPVLVNPGGTVRYCSEEKVIAESCAIIKGIYNPDTKQCDVDEGCLFKDTYTTLTCSGGGGCDMRLGGAKPNRYTGGASCPSGSSALLTHSSSWTRKISCGKKCTTNQSNSMRWYSCMACP